MIIIKTNEEVELMRQSALLVSKTLTQVAKMLKPGLTTLAIDDFIGEFIHDHKAIPSFLNYHIAKVIPTLFIIPNRHLK